MHVGTMNRLVTLLLLLFLFSCTTVKMSLDMPEGISASADKIIVKGVKGSGLVGTRQKIKYSSTFTGQRKNGWTTDMSSFERTPGGFFSEEAIKRSLLQNVGVNINNVSSRRVEKFQLTVNENGESITAACKQVYFGTSITTDIQNVINYSKGLSQASVFNAVLTPTSANTKPWLLQSAYSRETPNGIIQATLEGGMPTEKGYLTNGTDSIYVQSVRINRNTQNIPEGHLLKGLEINGGFSFSWNGKIVGVVDIFNTSIWLFPDTPANLKLVIATAATIFMIRQA